jgi:hypothetical protein
MGRKSSPGENGLAENLSSALQARIPGVRHMTEEVPRQKRRYPRISLPKGMWVAWHGGDLQLF